MKASQGTVESVSTVAKDRILEALGIPLLSGFLRLVSAVSSILSPFQ